MAATVWKGHLGFGLISIPVRLSRAARAERVSLRQLAPALRPEPAAPAAKVIELPPPRLAVPAAACPPDPSAAGDPAAGPPRRNIGSQEPPSPPPREEVTRVRHEVVTQTGGERIPAAELVKGYEVAPDEWVVLEQNDLKQVAARTSQTIDIREFVPFAAIDPVYLESSYYVAPERQGERAYALLYQALEETGRAALAEIAMHGREHVLVIRAGRKGLIAHTMFYENEVRRDLEYPAADTVEPRELELARLFVQSLEAPFSPERYRDRYRERLEALVAAKAAGRTVAAEPEAGPAASRPRDDLIAALEKSLAGLNVRPPEPAAARKPAAAMPSKKNKGRKAR